MEKLQLGTPDGTVENIDRIVELFPQVVTEVEGENGSVERAVDFDALRELLGDVAEGNRERYQFTWPGKRNAKAEANTPTEDTMRPCLDESVDWDKTQNLYIVGDNFDALRLLRHTYAGRIKLIYIDPPYNTGNDTFVYPDDYAQASSDYTAINGDFDEMGSRLRANVESYGRFHSVWCSMIYQRLLVARDLLHNKGAIFISIDDSEYGNLRKICDEVFGASNFVASIPRQSRASVQNDTDLSSSHEYVLAYAKFRRIENRRLKEGNAQTWFSSDSFACYPKPLDRERYSNFDDDPRGLWKSDPFDAPNVRPNLTYPITNPNTGEQFLPPRGRHWRTTAEQYDRLLRDGRIVFGANGKGRPQLKVFYDEKKSFGEIDNTWWDATRIPVNSSASKELMELFDGEKVFDTPKPHELIENIIRLALGESSDAIVLDFFAGSASTAEAVFRCNVEDGGSRKFLLVQYPEPLKEDSAAYALGYRTVSDIGAERIRRVGKKIAAEIDEANKQLELGADPKPYPDLGFRVLTIDTSNMKDTYFTPEDTEQSRLLDTVDNLKEGRASLDLLFEVLPKFRIPYSAKIEERELCGKQCFIVNDKQLIACFDVNVGADTIEAIAKLEPVYAVMRDASMADDATQANFEELFKTYSPDTVRRVI